MRTRTQIPALTPEPRQADRERARRRHTVGSCSSSPPGLEAGVLLAVNQPVARSANVAVFLPAIRVFSSGCVLEVEVVSRQATLSEDDWWELRMAVHGVSRGFRGPRLPDKLLRLGVRYPDGRKATTLDRHRRDCGDNPHLRTRRHRCHRGSAPAGLLLARVTAAEPAGRFWVPWLSSCRGGRVGW